MCTPRLIATAAGLLVAIIVGAAPALADQSPTVVEGVVVQADHAELVIDLGRDHGLPIDAELQLYRRLEVIHPVSGDVLVDRFPIGPVRLTQVGRVMSIAAPDGGLTRLPTVGDFAVYEPTSGASPGPLLGPSDGAFDDERLELEHTFQRTLGRPLTERIGLWEDYLSAHPASQHVGEVGRELGWLRDLLSQQRAAEASALPPPPPRLRSHLSIPTHVVAGRSFDGAVTIANADEVEQVRLLVRRMGDINFSTLAMTRSGDANWRLTLQQEWAAVGAIELYAEAVRTNGDLELLAGSGARPLNIAVVAPAPDDPDTRGRSRATAVVEFVDFDSGPAVDQYLRVEADFHYSLDLYWLTGFRVGAGMFQGEGASLDVLERGGPSQVRNVTYGFAEAEMSAGTLFGAAFHVKVGNAQRQSDQQFRSAFGSGLRLRFGPEFGTRLELGGAFIDEVGNEAWTEFFIDVVERFPMSASVVVTNLPVGEDLGVGLNYALGWRATDWFTLSARVGANARTIDHFGFTGGLSTAIEW